MGKQKKPRRQCAHCPWKVTTDPHDIPGGYCTTKHANLSGTIADPGSIAGLGRPLRIMACHETTGRRELPCVGWIAHQMGDGNNLPLRVAVANGQFNADVVTVGPQHTRFEDTLPRSEEVRA